MAERRRQPRFLITLPVLAELPGRDEINVMAKDISLGGIGLLGDVLKDIRGPLGGILYNIDENTPLRNLRFHGAVRHTGEAGTLGVKFSWISPVEKMELNKLLRELQKRT